jgi:hypothetical protein
VFLVLTALYEVFAVAVSILIAVNVDGWSTGERWVLGIAIFVALEIVGCILVLAVWLVWSAIFWLLTGERLSGARS